MPERFDLNAIHLVGVIQKLWGRGDDVFARLRVSKRDLIVEGDDAQSSLVTLVFPGGKITGRHVTLQVGDIIRLSGFLRHSEYKESLRAFLTEARAESFWDIVPPDDLERWREVSFKRVNALIVVRRIVWLNPDGKVIASDAGVPEQETGRIDADRLPGKEVLNQANIEGVVARHWEHTRRSDGVTDLYVRLAVYDRFTHVVEGVTGNFGRTRRKAHYITLRFPDGMTAEGRTVVVDTKNRMRAVGMVTDRGHEVSLREALLQTGDTKVAEMMARLPNADKLAEIAVQNEQTYVDVMSTVVYS